MGWIRRDVTGRLCGKLVLLWSGLSIGVAFVATPAKFLAPSLSLPVALDVGRETFLIYNGVEMILGLGALILAASSAARRRWLAWLAVPLLIVLLERLVLLPGLDARTVMVQRGVAAPGSWLHEFYIWAEVVKLGVLLAAGLSFDPTRLRLRPPGFKLSSWMAIRPRFEP
jgi:hypothetical protein